MRYVQDEPENQGAWQFMELHLPAAIAEELPGYHLRMRPFTRATAASPSVGSHDVHERQQHDLLTSALSD